MRLAFFEDAHAGELTPIALARPVFELLCGRYTLRERLIRRLNVADWGVLVRGYLEDVYREAHPEAHVNDVEWLSRQPTVMVNGRWLPDRDLPGQCEPDTVGLIGDSIAYLVLRPEEARRLAGEDRDEALRRIAGTRRAVPATGTLIRYPWDLIERNSFQLRLDAQQAGAPRSGPASPKVLRELGPHVAILGPARDIDVDARAVVDPFVVLDARGGPISIGPGARIGAFTQLQGPCHIGRESQLFRAFIREGTSLGPGCRVGGEVEASILHGYVNKYHAGFLGHSYVCPWVNLGALTTNSDLKNDYSTVKVPLWGEPIETGSTKVGCFIGDHTKTALDSLFNTGSSIGVMCMVLPAGGLLPKHVPSFARVWNGRLDDGANLAQCLATAETVLARRGQVLTPAARRLLAFLHEATAEERRAAVLRWQQKQAGDLTDAYAAARKSA